MTLYKLVWNGETIEEDLTEEDAFYLQKEYSMAYKSFVQMKKQKV